MRTSISIRSILRARVPRKLDKAGKKEFKAGLKMQSMEYTRKAREIYSECLRKGQELFAYGEWILKCSQAVERHRLVEFELPSSLKHDFDRFTLKGGMLHENL